MGNHSAAVTAVPAGARGTADPKIVILMLCAVVTFVLGAAGIRNGVFDAMSTDDAMRLVEVRDLIAGQGWFDLTQYRLDPPGLPMHWSRVIDAPLAAMILVLRPLLGVEGAEAATLVLWPSLLFGATLVAVAATGRRISDDANRDMVQLAAIVLAALSIPALIHFRAGAIDHHNFQIVLLLAFLFLTLGIERHVIDAALGGIAASLSLAVGLEMVPAIAATCVAVLGLLLWRGSAVSRQACVFGAAVAGSSLLLAALLLPAHSLGAPVCDAFGGPFLLLSAGGGISLVIVAGVAWRWPAPGARIATAAATGVILFAAFYKLFAGCLAPPFAGIDPLVTSIWVDHVAESMSFQTVLLLEPQKVPGLYGFPLLTLLLAGAAILRSRPAFRFRLIAAAVTLAALIGMSFWLMRGAAAANMVAAPLFSVSLALLWPARMRGRRLLLLAILASPASIAAGGLAARPLIDAILQPQRTIAARDNVASCLTVSSVAPLAALAPGRVMAPIDLGPAILAATGHSVFAAPYHRNNDGNLAMLQLMLAAPAAAKQILADRRVDYVVLCRGNTEHVELSNLAPNGLAARLDRGEGPDFLQPVEHLDPSGKLAVWRVRRNALP
jgi:hypothetical protein